jgi:hypothetical protein
MTTETKKATTDTEKAMKAKEAKMKEQSDRKDVLQGTRLSKRFNKTYLALEKLEISIAKELISMLPKASNDAGRGICLAEDMGVAA